MAALPVAADVRAELVNYCGVDSTLVPDAWIDRQITKMVLPYVQKYTRRNLLGTTQTTEFYSGTGGTLLILNRRPIISVDVIRFVANFQAPYVLNLSNIETIYDEGILKAKGLVEDIPGNNYLFPRGVDNIKVTYTYGDNGNIPDDLAQAIVYLACERLLGHVEGMTGGGAPSGVSYTKAYGARGKYTNIRNDLARLAMGIIRQYMTGVVGS